MFSADSVNFSNFMLLDACFSVMTISLNTVWTRGAVFRVIVGSTLHVPSFEYLHPLYKWPEGVNRHAICSWKGELLIMFWTSVPLTFISQHLRSAPSLACITLHYYPGARGGGGGWGGVGTSYSVLYEEVSKERGTFLRPRVYERVGISLVEVCKRVGSEIGLYVCKKTQKG